MLRTAANNPIPVPGAVAHPHYDYNAIMRRNIGYNDFFHRSIAKDRIAVKNNPNDAQAQEQLGCTLYSSRWRLVRENLFTTPAAPLVQEEAFSHLRRAVILRPDQVDWQFTLGYYLYKSAYYQQAIPHLERCLKLLRIKNPNNVQPRKGKKTLTKEQLLFLHDPRAGMALFSLGDAWNKAGKRTEARVVWHNIITLCPSGSYDVKLAQRKLVQFPAVQ